MIFLHFIEFANSNYKSSWCSTAGLLVVFSAYRTEPSLRCPGCSGPPHLHHFFLIQNLPDMNTQLETGNSPGWGNRQHSFACLATDCSQPQPPHYPVSRLTGPAIDCEPGSRRSNSATTQKHQQSALDRPVSFVVKHDGSYWALIWTNTNLIRFN